MQPDFEHIKKLWTIYEGAILDEAAYLAAATELRTLPNRLFEALSELESADSDTVEAESPEFERTFRQYYSREAKPTKTPEYDEELEGEEVEGEEGDGEELDLVPFAGFPQYLLDVWGRPHGLGGQGQKVGPLIPLKQWKPAAKGRKARFIYGYRLYLDGERVYKSALQCAIARFNVETAPQKARYLADKDRKGKFEK